MGNERWEDSVNDGGDDFDRETARGRPYCALSTRVWEENTDAFVRQRFLCNAAQYAIFMQRRLYCSAGRPRMNEMFCRAILLR